MASIRKIKKRIKAVDNKAFRKSALSDIRFIKQWSRIDHHNSKSNMQILTGNFLRNGKLLVKPFER